MQITEGLCQIGRMATPGRQWVDSADGTPGYMRVMLEESALTIQRRRQVVANSER